MTPTQRHDMAEHIAIEHIAWLRGRGVTLPSLCQELGLLSDHFKNWDQVIVYYAREWLRINGYTEENSLLDYDYVPCLYK